MYRAMVDYTIGCGLKVGLLVGETFAELEEKIQKLLDSNITIERVKYVYPSGKHYTKRF